MFIKLLNRLMDEKESAEGEALGGEETVGSEANSAEVNEDEGVWGDMFDSHNSDEPIEDGENLDSEVESSTPAGDDSETTEPQAEKPAEPKVEEPPKAEEPQPPAEPQTQQTSTEQEAQQQTPQEGLTPEQHQRVQEETARIRGQIENQLTDLYALQPDDAELFQLEPEKVLPKVAAKLHMNIVEAMHEGVQQMLPQMIQQVTQQQEVQQKSVGAFFEAWPALNDEQHMDTVVRVVENYKRYNPNATLEQVINEAGAAAMIALKLPVEGIPSTQQQRQPAPAQQQQGNYAQTPPPPPAAPNAASQSVQPQSDNIFEQMFEETLQDD